MREEETVFVHVDADLSADFDRLVQCRRTPTPSPPPSWHKHDDVRTDEMDHQQQQQQLQRTPDACKEIKSSVRRQHIRAERCRCPIAHTVVLYARSGTSPQPPQQHDGVEDVVVKDDAQQHNDVHLFVFVDVRQAKRLLAYRGAPPPGVSAHDTTPAVMGYLQRIATCATRAIPSTTTTTSSSHVLVHIIVAPRVVAAEVARTTTTPTTSAHLTAREHALFLAAVASWGGELLHGPTTNDDGGCVRLGIVESVIDAAQAVDRVLSMMKKMLQRPHTTATTTSLSQHGMLAHATTTTATASRAEVSSMCAEDERASAAAVWECVRPDCNTKADATDHRVLFRSMLMEVWSYSEMKILAAMRVFPTMHSLLTCVDELVKRSNNNNNNNNNMLVGADADAAARMKVMASALDEDGRSYNVLNDAMVRALTADYRRLLFPEGDGGCDDDG